MKSKPTHCICGSRLVKGEAEIEPIKGVKMLVPALLCLNDYCKANLGFIVEDAVMKSAQYWALFGEKEYKGLVDTHNNLKH